ncbi:MAG: hypothetical protein HRT89_06310, partial [Lentisphaeria bacterium]|nr:hypothetical protein [Lentisphaeria bacterium]
GIDLKGNLCLLSSEGEKPHTPKFRLAFLSAKEKKWTFKEMVLPHRHCYSYVFPLGPSSLKLVSTRDVRWHEIGLKKTPRGAPHGFSFNAFRSWYIEDVLKPEFKEQHFIEEKGTTDFPFSFCNAQNDSYIDSKGRLHILYRVEGERTKGREQRFHLMLSASGEKLKEARIPDAAGVYCRIIEDDRGNFYILGSGGKRKGDGFTAGKAVIYEAGKDGFKTDKAIPLDLGSEKVEYSGFALACPRNGTALGQNLDLVFPSGPQGIKWNYCRIKLYSD